jgi:DNA-binding winged helix-turn-helix (wHTH) protein/TolB-like protein
MRDARWAIGESRNSSSRPGDRAEFEFDVATGELRHHDGETQRLGPQPAALLNLLIERRGGVVGREEIRTALWPDVNVEFDASLHHCVRQVRAAFGERASEARYIETIPKRGYRLKCPAVMIADEPPESAAVLEPTVAPVQRSRRRMLPMLGLGVLGLGALAVWLMRPKPLRVAIMPFDNSDMSPAIMNMAARLGEQVLAELTHRLGPRADVLGPRTTGPLRDRGLSLADIAEQLDVGYVINARHTAPAALLIELIRSSDGKHVWVELYDEPARWDAAGPEIVDELARTLESS